jgi:hypothetical protein
VINGVTSFVSTIADAALGVAMPSSISSAGASTAVPAGSTSLGVYDGAQFSGAGGVALVTPAGGAVNLVTYTGRSASSGRADLTGVPASGVGSITAAIPLGSSVQNIPALTGIPASGAGAITGAIAAGDAVALFVQVDDTTAQTALATLEGGDGIQEHLVTDSSIATVADATTRGTADLTLFKTANTDVSFESRDVNLAPGTTATISIGAPTNVSATLTVQSVTIARFEEQPTAPLFPVRQANVASTRLTLDDLLRLIPVAKK